ncbi:hypothetical protein JCM6882_001579 [Rhodosporidiobolus microsporus]
MSYNATTTPAPNAETRNVGAEAGERTGIAAALASHPTSASTSSSAPPVHAPSSVAADSTSTYDTTRVSAAERTRGIFGAIKGAGDAIRGTINSGLDGLGDGIAGRPQGSATSRTSAAGEESIAERGKREFEEGVAAMKGQGTTHGTGTGTHTTNTAL